MEKREKLNTLFKCRCSEVTLDEFIDCLVNENYARLLKAPAPAAATPEQEADTDAALQEAWSLLYQDYTKQSGDKKNQYIFSLYRRRAVLAAKLRLAEQLLSTPLTDEQRTKLFKEVGYSGDLRQITAKIKQDTVLYQGAEKELEKAQERTGGETMTERHFLRWIISVSKFMGYRIDRHSVTVTEFLEMNREWEETVKAKNKLHGKR